MIDCLVVLALPQKGYSHVVMNFGAKRIYLQRLLEMSESAIEISFVREDDAEVVMCVQEIRLDFQFLLKLSNRVIDPSIIQQYCTQVVVYPRAVWTYVDNLLKVDA